MVLMRPAQLRILYMTTRTAARCRTKIPHRASCSSSTWLYSLCNIDDSSREHHVQPLLPWPGAGLPTRASPRRGARPACLDGWKQLLWAFLTGRVQDFWRILQGFHRILGYLLWSLQKGSQLQAGFNVGAWKELSGACATIFVALR